MQSFPRSLSPTMYEALISRRWAGRDEDEQDCDREPANSLKVRNG